MLKPDVQPSALELESQVAGNPTASIEKPSLGVEPDQEAPPVIVPSDNSEDALLEGWRQENKTVTLSESHGAIGVPGQGAPWWKQWAAYVGVGCMVAVGYMDPGNWATDIQAGAAFGYTLLIVVLLASVTAMFLQFLSLKLGVATGRDLAQACRDSYPPKVVWVLWVIAEIAIAATDLAEVIGSAVALNLLFHLPIWAGVLITGADVLFIVFFGCKSFRVLEVLIIFLCLTIATCFAYELGAAKPAWNLVAKGFIPKPVILTDREMLYTSIGILGATVMPHNLYLHSSIVQTRAYPRTLEGRRTAIKYAWIDSNVSLSLAFFVNAAILILASAVFHYGPRADRTVADITTAYKLLEPALGDKVAPKLFAIALLCSGQQSTITGTLSGQIVMEGFLNFRMSAWLRRMVTRVIAIVPAVAVAAAVGDAGVGKLLVLSQVVLSLALSFAVIPLVHFTSTPAKMKAFVNPMWTRVLGGLVAAIIAGLNVYLVVASIKDNEFATAGQA